MSADHPNPAPVEAVEVLKPEPRADVVPVARAELVTAAPVGDVVALQRRYHELCAALLDDSNYQNIGGRRFRKKSAWRKLATAFNVSVTVIERHYERDEAGRIVRAEVVSRAAAPNGRTVDGLGLCDRFERCCVLGCTKGGRHHHCPAADDRPCRVAHFSNAEHDIPTTAMTRATNRACADLFGMGEVSAEEVSDRGDLGGDGYGDREPESSSLATSSRRARPAGSSSRSRRREAATPAGNGPELTAAAIEARVACLPDELVEGFHEWMAKTNMPWPPTTTAVVAQMARRLTELEAARAGGSEKAVP
jgi:hypothetical protein